MKLKQMQRATILSAATLWAAATPVQGQCDPPRIPFEPNRHREVYTVGVLAIRGNEAAYDEFNSTFSDYLTATAGQRFDPPVRFQMKPLNFVQVFSDTQDQLVDFIYANPSGKQSRVARSAVCLLQVRLKTRMNCIIYIHLFFFGFHPLFLFWLFLSPRNLWRQ